MAKQKGLKSNRRTGDAGGCEATAFRVPRCLLLWVAPLVGVVVCPLHLHASMPDLGREGLQAATPDVIENVAIPLLLVVGVSILACVADQVFVCGGVFPWIVVVFQAVLLLLFSWFGSAPGEPSAAGAIDVTGAPPRRFGRPLDAEEVSLQESLIGSDSQLRGSASAVLPAPSPSSPPPAPSEGLGRFSVVLACAMEGEYMVKTVQSFCDRTPVEILQEIVVVDDGSTPPLEGMLINIDAKCKVKVYRHPETLGLMVAKQTGGDKATGEYIGFFDCHVAPNIGWHKELMQVLAGGQRRLAVPTITDLDLDTWDEKQQSASNSKCYIDFNAQFMWFDDESDYIPIISGGLVALTQQWWRESAGFDSHMRGWGGENVDQSLRTWLCGGEILRAKSSRIAHMWRVPHDARTTAHYKRVGGVDNTARVAASWFDEFLVKFRDGSMARQNHGVDVRNVVEVKSKLGCKPFAYFLHRFRKVYQQGGLLPIKVFRLKSAKTGRCITRRGGYGMGDCASAIWLHLANQNTKKSSKCCSGIRQWGSMDCFDRLDPAGPLPYYCDVTGKNLNQQYEWDDGLIRHDGHTCLSEAPGGSQLRPQPCSEASRWLQIDSFLPEETVRYEAAVKRLGLAADSPDN